MQVPKSSDKGAFRIKDENVAWKQRSLLRRETRLAQSPRDARRLCPQPYLTA